MSWPASTITVPVTTYHQRSYVERYSGHIRASTELKHHPQGRRQIPSDAHENDLLRKMRPLETDRHRRAPSCITVGHRGRSYRKSPQREIATKPISTIRGPFHYDRMLGIWQ